MRKLSIFLGIAIVVFVTAQIAHATQVINDTLQVNSLKVGQQGLGGVTYFNGTIINSTTSSGADNPVTFGDNVRIDGSVYRGATAGTSDTLPFKINDNVEIAGSLTVKGALTAGSISGLSGMVSSAGFAQMTDLVSYAKTADLTPYAKTTDLVSYAKTTDLSAYALSTTVSDLTTREDLYYYWQNAVYQYNRCVLYLDQLLTYPTMVEMQWCWDNWVGSSIEPTSFQVTTYSPLSLSRKESDLEFSAKIQAEKDRAAAGNK